MIDTKGLKNRECCEKHVIFIQQTFLYRVWEKALFAF